MLFGRQKEPKFFLFLFLFFLGFLLSSPGDFAQEIGPRSEALFSNQDGILEKVNLLALYVVENGKRRSILYKGADLRSGREPEVKGYVCGVVVLCNDEVEAGLEGRPMSRIRENDDGTLICKYFGPLQSADSIFPYLEAVNQKKTFGYESPEKESNYLFGGYSYFPKVMGSSVSGNDRFIVCLKKGKASARIFIRQQENRTIYKFRPGTAEEIIVQYQGTSLTGPLDGIRDLRQKLTVVFEGIRSVEDRFDAGLVTRVNLVDYGAIRNAVTCEGGREIWLYIKALREEPLAELKTMAAHETLHLLVDRMGFANDEDLLGYFADLKGFDLLSSARFVLMTRGVVAEKSENDGKENEIFFSFINERNFLEGMKGGHAHQNPDEFCASFLHSLMFIDRLADNLDRPLVLQGHQHPHPRLLTLQEKQDVLKAYTRTIGILSRSVPMGGESRNRSGRINNFLEQAHLRAERELKKLVSLTGDSGSEETFSARPSS